MSKTITNDAGEEEVVYTQAELDTQLADKDAHVAAKLEEFKTGKSAQELESAANKAAIEAIKKESDEVKATIASAQTKARDRVVGFLVEQVVGEDVELKKKLESELSIVEAGFKAQGKDVSDDKVIQEMIIKASAMAGISGSSAPSFPLMGGYMPHTDLKKEGVGSGSDQDNETFKKAVGYKDEPKKA